MTIEEKDGKTFLVMHELYPSKEALDDMAIEGMDEAMPATFEQLDEFLVARGAGIALGDRFLAERGHSDPWEGKLADIKMR